MKENNTRNNIKEHDIKKQKKPKASPEIQSKQASLLSLWAEFFWKGRTNHFLFLLTLLIFITVCCLYHLDNLPKLGYAALLSVFFWAVGHIIEGIRYVGKRRKLETLTFSGEDSEELVWQNLENIISNETEGLQKTKESRLEGDYLELIEQLCQQNRLFFATGEAKREEQSNYYLMWAHQIKTPISAMKLLLNGEMGSRKESFLLQEELFKVEQYVEMALHFQRLESMEADMLLQEYDLYTLLKQAVRKYSVLFINRGLSLELEEMQQKIVTDEKWLSFCVEQIVSNSIKYTYKGSIAIYLAKEEPCTLVIEDTGMGIRAEDLPRIFERGFTGYNGRMDKKSTGIGLYLCKRILDKLGNEIRVSSEEGNGTRVYISLITPKGISAK